MVKWFKNDKGFGFVELGNGTGDAFLHIGAVQAAGYETLPPGAKLKVQVTNSVKGQQVARVLEVDLAGAPNARPRLRPVAAALAAAVSTVRARAAPLQTRPPPSP